MKLIKHRPISLLFSALMIALVFSSCEKDFGDINKSWDNKVYTATIPALFNGITASMADAPVILYSCWIYQNTQLAAMYAAGGFRLDNFTANGWNNYYRALANYRKLEEMIDADANAANMTNVKGMAKVLMAYKTLKLTMMYGDMPYTDAGKGFVSSEFFRPKYDSQESVIKAALAELKWAIDNMAVSSTQVSLGAAETIFANDISKWIKLANSLRLRYAMVLLEKASADANTIIAEALAKPLLQPDEYYGLYPATISDFFNNRLIGGNAGYVSMGTTMWNSMSSSNEKDGSGIFDPRCKIFFEPNAFGEWVPFPQVPSNDTPTEVGNEGVNAPYSEQRLTTYYPVGASWRYSPLNFYYLDDKTFPQVFISGAEVSFLKAEIYNRGIGGVGANPATAKSNYEAGITESVKFWFKTANGSGIWAVNKPAATPSSEEMSTLMNNPQVAFSSDAATALKQIYKQHWIELFHQPLEAWTLARRTAYATPSVTLLTVSPGYNFFRLTYPQSEIDGNFDNWSAVTGGSDTPTVKPWFMK
jgi:hypothetical protein